MNSVKAIQGKLINFIVLCNSRAKNKGIVFQMTIGPLMVLKKSNQNIFQNLQQTLSVANEKY